MEATDAGGGRGRLAAVVMLLMSWVVLPSYARDVGEKFGIVDAPGVAMDG